MKSPIRISFIICLTMFPAMVTGGSYLGAAIGYSYVDQSLFAESGTGIKVFGGIGLNSYFSVEAAYMDLGQPQEDLFGLQQDYDVWAAGLWAKGMLPLGSRIIVFGKAGLAHWDLEKTTTFFGLSSQTVSQSGNDPIWGVGMEFKIGDRYSMPLEYERIESEDDEIALFSIGIVYRF
ncbi:MAG: outer membrane beta-barrel protein [Gammaproteobacteria bacterium]|nr:outer membrane beta-barrel protein [Gammaproteobacteria bacterium]